MERKEIESAVEAILFASGEPVQVKRLCGALELARPAVERALQDLRDHYAFERRGIRLSQMDDSWQLCSAPEYGDAVHRALEVRKPAKLSQPALEALTIIAYYQPTTRANVDQIRGVDSAYTMSLLLNRDLIEECGRLQAPGRPRLYRTTKQFLRAFHLNSLEELPELETLAEPEDEVQMRLGEHGEIVDAEGAEEETE
ncbi:MAG: SMC-Scp complex subunit ScpB [Oscillibacter sp.]|nr:SMC-Scp complex subunit ScpB [Oscillibacter sp.]MCI9001844.1 SMC-Scp complex subunit ScpB [Oscillibacter sp.]